MNIGNVPAQLASDRPDLLAPSVADAVRAWDASVPADWPILIDAAVAAAERVVIGSGVRRSKISLPGAALAQLQNAVVLTGLGRTTA